MIVMKFGGTSVGDAARIRGVAGIVKAGIKRKPIVIVSAITKITDLLLKSVNESAGYVKEIKERHLHICRELGIGSGIIEGELKELETLSRKIPLHPDEKFIDNFVSFGERLSSRIVAACMQKEDIDALAFNSYDLGMLTDSNFGNAEALPETEALLKEALKNAGNIVPVITGFIAKDKFGNITTFGRGGSDYTASLIGSAVNAEEIQIWTDVDGIMTSDPKIVKNARTIDVVSFDEASELAYFGAKVLHPKTILPAMRKNIPVRVLNALNPGGKGTSIVKEPSDRKIKAIACKKNISVINMHSTRMLLAYGFLHKLFEVFDQCKIPVDMISTSEVGVSLTVEKGVAMGNALERLSKIADVNVESNKGCICVIGDGIKTMPEVAGKIFDIMGKHKINIDMISQGASEVNIGFVVGGEDVENAVLLLHRAFFEAK